MDFIHKSKTLEHRPDSLFRIRKEYNLDKPEAMEDAIRILREWVEKQKHFKKKDFPDHYLETAIITSKGSVEHAKTQIDRLCTFRTIPPQFFGVYNVKTDFGILFDAINPIVLPKLTRDLYRVLIVRGNSKVKLLKDFLDYFKYGITVAEYVRRYDYCLGYYAIVDLTGRLRKGINLFSQSKLVDSFIALLKQVFSQKISDRIHSHKSLDELSNILPIEIFPVEYGGKERPYMTIFEELSEELSSKEFLNHLKDMSESGTDESCCQEDKINEQYAGVSGTFRTLSID